MPFQQGNTEWAKRKSNPGGHTHGLRYTSEYEAWHNMKLRCTNPRHPSYKYYGGRGIAVCPSWLLFENFIADMGRKPGPEYTLERKNNDGHYIQGNCKWATRSEQMSNRRQRA